MSQDNLIDIPMSDFSIVFDTKDVLSWIIKVYYDEVYERETVTLLVPGPTEMHEVARAHSMYANRMARFRTLPIRTFAFRGTFAEMIQVLAREIDPNGKLGEAFATLYDWLGLTAPEVVPDGEPTAQRPTEEILELVDPPRRTRPPGTARRTGGGLLSGTR